MSDGYKYYSQTMSGWVISTDPKAAPEKRWRAVHPEMGERFFAEHDQILDMTVQIMAEQLKKLFEKPRGKR
jgi:hypothetical protein